MVDYSINYLLMKLYDANFTAVDVEYKEKKIYFLQLQNRPALGSIAYCSATSRKPWHCSSENNMPALSE